MDTPISIASRQQLETNLTQKIQALYRDKLGQDSVRVSCRLFDNKLAIVLEDAISRPIQILAENNQKNLAQQVRLNIEAAIKPQLVQTIEQLLQVKVIDLLFDTTIETGRTGTIAILTGLPKLSNMDGKSSENQTSEVIRK